MDKFYETNYEMPDEDNDLYSDVLGKLADEIDKISGDESANGWQPNKGRQTEGFHSEAFETLYGGSAGGGKTDLMVGLSVSPDSPHKDAIIYRSTMGEHIHFIRRIISVAKKYGAKPKFVAGARNEFVGLPFGKSLQIGYVNNADAAEKYRGRPHDLIMFDELATIDEDVYTFLIGWARAADTELNQEHQQKVRVFSASNPPRKASEEWIIKRWRCWIDPEHPDPAEPGELRWFANLDGEDTEITEAISVEGSQGKPFVYKTREGRIENITPTSRTFIPATLDDNPYLANTNYRATLQSLKEPLRSQLLYGDFRIGRREDVWKIVPKALLDRSHELWEEAKNSGRIERYTKANIVYGLDVAEEGDDKTVFVKISGNIVLSIDVIDESDPFEIAKVVATEMKRHKGAIIAVDIIGPGLAVAKKLSVDYGIKVLSIKGSKGSNRKDKDKMFGFFNVASELWWRVREQIEVDNEEEMLLIPKHKLLREELLAPRYEIVTVSNQLVIKSEKKEIVKKRLHRSPDYANALQYAIHAKILSNNPPRIV